MPKRTDIRKILVFGSGPIVIGQACEFDYSGTQAIQALKQEGYQVILLNSNPATIMTDPSMADRVYIEPLQIDFAKKIIEAERPDAILPTVGGQVALNLAVALYKEGILDRYNIELLGASVHAIEAAEDRDLFKSRMNQLGIDVPRSRVVTKLEDGLKVLEELGIPLVLRPSFTLGGEGGGIVYTKESFLHSLQFALSSSPSSSVLIEEYLDGWKEFELEVLRDCADQFVVVCSIENIDPLGIHTGDSITVAPSLTLSDRQFQLLRDYSAMILRNIGIETGGCNIQFAINPRNGRTVVIEMNPRVSRSSALASKATGVPIAQLAAQLAVGYRLDELKNTITKTTSACFEPTLDYVVTKIPRFDFEKFGGEVLLGTQMRSVGEVMALGSSFKESFLKALQGIESPRVSYLQTEFDQILPYFKDLPGMGSSLDSQKDLSHEALKKELKKTTYRRAQLIASALRRKLSINEIHSYTHVDPWFLNQFKEIIDLEERLLNIKSDSASDQNAWKELLIEAKVAGFSDEWISKLARISIDKLRAQRAAWYIQPRSESVDTCSGEFQAQTPYYYSTYMTPASSLTHAQTSNVSETTLDPFTGDQRSYIVLGSGPNRIGQGIEFDYCCVQASRGIQELGHKSIMLNYNPETVSTDHDVSDVLYFDPITPEFVNYIYKKEHAQGIFVQFGGQTPLKIAHQLEAIGCKILGSPLKTIDLTEDRELFKTFLASFSDVHQARSLTVQTPSEVEAALKTLKFPILVRPSYVLGGRGMKLVYTKEALYKHLEEVFELSGKKPVLLDEYLSSAIELDVDAISDGDDVAICGILEHIEEAGVHSGDSACSFPSFSLSNPMIKKIEVLVTQMTKALKVKGLINFQFALKKHENETRIYLLEANPRASRTIPFLSKARGIPFAKIATQVCLGTPLKNFKPLLDQPDNALFNIKMPIFVFQRFAESDIILGPEMKSTGEVMGRGKTLGEALAKSYLGAGFKLPSSGRILISVASHDKTQDLVQISRQFVHLGYSLMATPGTFQFLNQSGIPCQVIQKFSTAKSSELNCVEALKKGYFHMVVNTPSDEASYTDGFAIRRAALEKRILHFTRLSSARLALEALDFMQQVEHGQQVLSLLPL